MSTLFALVLFTATNIGLAHYVLALDGSGSMTVSPTSTNAGSTGGTYTFTFTAAETMDSGSISLTIPSGWTTPQLTNGVAGYTTVTGTARTASILDNADSASGWSAGSSCTGSFGLDTSVKKEGTGSIKCVNSNNGVNSKFYKNFTAQNWSGYTTVGFWIRVSAGINNGDLRFDYDDSANIASPLEDLSLGKAIPANTWTYVSFALSGSITRTSVTSFGFRIANASNLKNATLNVDYFLAGPASSGGITIVGNTITVNALTMATNTTMIITYGAGGGTSGVTATSTPGVSTFTTQSRASASGSLTNIASQPTVTVLASTPTVTNITSSLANGSYKAGQVVPIQVTFSQVVNVTGTPQITLSTGSPATTLVNYSSGTGSNTLTFNYTVSAGNTSADLDYASIGALILNGGTIKNAGGTNASLTLPSPGAAGSLGANKNIVIDTTAPTLAQVTPVPTVTSSTTPSYTFSSTEAGTITYGGDCSSTATSTTGGSKTITFNTLSAGTHSNCTITVTDAAGNTSSVLTIPSFTIDTTAPTLAVVTPVTTPTNSTTPSFSFSTTEAGTITYGGSCSSATTSTSAGTTTITFNALSQGTYSNCTITVTDAAGNPSSALAVPSFTIDTTAPTLAVVTPVPTATSSTTPSFTFSSTEAGTITYGGDCSSTATSTTGGSKTITFNTLAPGTHSNCTIRVTDAAGNQSNLLSVPSFTIDTTAPTLAVVTPVPTPTNSTTPSFTFSSTEAGTITYGGDCSSSATSTTGGSKTITFNTLSAGTHSNCTITVTDAAGNTSSVLTIPSFTIDTTAPTLAVVTPVPTPTNNTTPSFSFSTTEAGTITYGGDCSASTTSTSSGTTTVTFNTLASGTHSNCTIRVTDAAGNQSNLLSVPSFTIDTTAPTLAVVTPVPTPTNSTTPSFSFSTNEAGTITYGGSCSSASTSTTAGTKTITFSTLGAGTYSDCTITVTDAAGNPSSALAVPSFTIDLTAPTLAVVTPVPTPTNNTTPSFTFSSTEAGTITYGGDCSSSATSTTGGSKTVTFNTLAPGTHSNCTIRVTDAAGNQSNLLSVPSFTIDTTAPTLAVVTPVPTPTNSTTPSFSFSTTEAGTITYGGDCSASTTSTSSGTTTVTFNTLAPGTHSNCTITITDAAGNTSSVLTIPSFTIDTTAPTLAVVTPVASPTNDTTPNFSFSTNEAGTITYGGSCSSASTSTTAGTKTITFSTLTPGTYSDCTITVTDAAGNPSTALTVPPFTIDTTAPTLAVVTPVTTPTNSTTPSFSFSTTEAGTITYGGSCSSATTSTSAGTTTITFNALSQGTYSNCTITVTDAAGNPSSALAVPSFTIDTTAPTLAVVTPVPTPTNSTTPSFSFSSTEAGTITYGGSCSSATTSTTSGTKTITFSTLGAGTYSDCTITVTDAVGNPSSPLAVPSFTIDLTPPTLAVVTPVPSPTNDTTPSFTFSTTEAGTITYGGSCSSATTSTTSGTKTITFSTLGAGTYSDCTITVTDAAGNPSSALAIPSFTIDTSAPTLAVVTPVPTPGNDATPDFTFSSTEAGTITYGGDCSSATTAASSGSNTVTFNTLSSGTHSNCTIRVTDAAGNQSNLLSVPSFSISTTAPVLAVVTPVTTPTNDTTPNFTFSTTEAGTITYGGSCSSATTSTTAGTKTITFSTLSAGTYSDCTIVIRDAYGNDSNTLAVPSFTIDTTAPTVTMVAPVPTPGHDTTPSVTFNTDEAGTITYGGSCSSLTSSASVGDNTITFAALGSGTYSNCTITVTDAAGNPSTVLNIPSFTIDTAAPVLAVVTPVTTPTNDTTPNFTFSTTEAGTITYGGSCSSATGSATAGSNTITFNALVPGTYADCTITVTDAAGNPSLVLNIASFTIDTSAPTLAVVTPVSDPTTDTTPSFTFSTTEAGTITYGGSCTSTSSSTVAGNKTITFSTLSQGAHADCTITVTDAAGNPSLALAVPSFTVDSIAPTLAVVTPVPTPSTNTTPSFTFSSTEGGSITYGGSCSSTTLTASSGNNTITFEALAIGTYTNCTVRVTDSAGNASNILAVPSFTITAVPPVATQLVILNPLDSTVGSSTTVTIQARTASGVLVSTYNGGVTLVFDGSASVVGGSPLVTITNGVGTVNVVDNIAETVHLSLSDTETTGLTVTSTQDVVFAPGLAASLELTQPGSMSAGNRTGFTLTRKDQYGNITTTGSETVYLYSGSTGTHKAFYDAAIGGGTITSIIIPNGSSSVDFWYYDEKAGTWTISASDNSTSPDGATGVDDATASIYVAPTSASQILMNDPGNTTAGTRSQYTVTREDAFGNPVTSTSLTVWLYTNSTSLNAKFYNASSGGSAITSVTIPNGSSSADAWYYDDLVGNWTITASDNGGGPDGALGLLDATDGIAISAGATAVYELNDPGDMVFGTRVGYTVTRKDAYGNLATSGAITVHLYTSSPDISSDFYNAAIGGSTISTVTISDTQSSANFWYGDTEIGAWTITASDNAAFPDGVAGITDGTDTINVLAAPIVATKFIIMPHAAGSVDDPMTITIKAVDDLGNVDTTINSSVTLNVNGSATGGGVVSMVNGVGTRTISDHVAETVTASLVDTAPTGLNVASTQSLVFEPGAVTSFTLSAPPNTTAGTLMGYVVTRKDQYGNPVTAGSTSVYFYTNSTGVNAKFYNAASGGSMVTSVSIGNGTSTATVWYGDELAGTWTITASDSTPTANGATGITDASDTIIYSPAATALYDLTDPGSMTVGTRLGYTVTRKDAYGNLTTSGAATVYLYTDSGSTNAKFYSAASGGTAITEKTIANGSSSANFWYYDDSIGTYTITASDNASGPDGAAGVADATDSVLVSASPIVADRFIIMDPPSATVGAGVTITIRATDAAGNIDTTYQHDVTLHVSGSGTGGGLVNIVNGVGTKVINDSVAETVTLTLIDSQTTGLDVASTKTVTFLPATSGGGRAGTAETTGGGGSSVGAGTGAAGSGSVTGVAPQAYVGSTVTMYAKIGGSETPYNQLFVESNDGKFPASAITPGGAPRLGLQAVDKNGLTSPTLFVSKNQKGDFTISPTYIFPPTIGLVRAIAKPGETITVYGYAAPNARVEISVDMASAASAVTADDQGAYRVIIQTTGLAQGQHTVRARQRSVEGRQSSYSLVLAFVIASIQRDIYDLNGDGHTDLRDWSIFLAKWNKKDPADKNLLDVNKDGIIDLADFSQFLHAIQQ